MSSGPEDDLCKSAHLLFTSRGEPSKGIRQVTRTVVKAASQQAVWWICGARAKPRQGAWE